MTRQEKIYQAVGILKYNILDPGHTTWGPCSRDGCEEPARGSGVCAKCAQKDLEEMTNTLWAGKVVASIEAVKKAYIDMDYTVGAVRSMKASDFKD